MNNSQFQTGQDLKLSFNGQITINAEMLNSFLAEMRPTNPDKPAAAISQASTSEKRLAYTMKETAEILGVSYITVHRLIQRGLLKPSLALRHKIIPKFEIERFLKETI